ncbi:MAG: tetratricopeptide repeat protein [Casimicrobiaceae bacterium]
MTEGYSLREVGKLLGLSRSMLGRLIDAGFVSPTRGRRREYRFTFRDLVLLRAAQGLTEARIPSSRILRSLRRLRTQLPQQVPLAGLRIEAVGDAVVVSEGDAQWRPDDGQYVMRFQVASPDGRLAFFGPAGTGSAPPDASWFDQGVALERTDPDEACAAYRRALMADATHRGAYVNLGRLLHEQGRTDEAETIYRNGLGACGADATLLFNLGIVLEDLQRPDEAAVTYRAALAAAPDMADAHFNLACLCEARGLQQDAVRHFSAFRKLTGRR